MTTFTYALGSNDFGNSVPGTSSSALESDDALGFFGNDAEDEDPHGEAERENTGEN